MIFIFVLIILIILVIIKFNKIIKWFNFKGTIAFLLALICFYFYGEISDFVKYRLPSKFKAELFVEDPVNEFYYTIQGFKNNKDCLYKIDSVRKKLFVNKKDTSEIYFCFLKGITNFYSKFPDVEKNVDQIRYKLKICGFIYDKSNPKLLTYCSFHYDEKKLLIVKKNEINHYELNLWFNYVEANRENLQGVLNSIEILHYHKTNKVLTYRIYNKNGRSDIVLNYYDFGKRFDLEIIR